MNLKHCQSCPNFPYCNRDESLINKKDSPILFVLDSPLSNSASKWFYRTLAAVFNVPQKTIKENINISYACQCSIPSDRYSGKDELKKIEQHCRKHLYIDTINLKPQLIVLAGRKAMKAFFGGNASVGTKRGRIFDGKLSFVKDKNNVWKTKISEDGEHSYKFLPTFYPDTVFSAFSLCKPFIADLTLCYKFIFQELKKQEIKYDMVSNDVELQEMINLVNKHKFTSVSCDVETTGLNPLVDTVTLIGLTFFNLTKDNSDNRYKTFVVDVKQYSVISDKPEVQKKRIAAHIFNNIPTLKYIVGVNFKFDLKMLYRYGLTKYPKWFIFDCQIVPHLLDNEKFGKKSLLSLEDLVSYYFPADVDYKSIKKKKKSKDPEISIEDTFYDYLYNAKDAYLTMLIAKKLYKDLSKSEHSKLYKLYKVLYTKLIPLLARMEYRGVAINVEKLLQLKEQSEIELKQLNKILRTIIYKSTGDKKLALKCKLSSADQMKKLFFDTWELPVLTKTKKGRPQLRKDDYLKYLYNIEQGNITTTKLIVKFFHTLKAYNLKRQHYTTFILGIYKNLDENGRIHTEYRLVGTESGRLSSVNINLQNIPKESTDTDIKSLFITSSSKHTMLDDDLSQIELREMAELSNDKGLKLAYKNKLDLHLLTAAKCADVKYEQALQEYTKDKASWDKRRFDAKTINFGLQYCMQAKTLAAKLTNYKEGRIVNEPEAQEYIDKFFDVYPGINSYIENQKAFVHEHGYAETLFGRKRYLSNIKSDNKWNVALAERQAVNTPIQGTAADIMFCVMVLLQRLFEKYKVNAHFILTVYDSMVIETVEPEQVKKCIKIAYANLLKFISKNFDITLKVPVEHSLAEGKEWGKLQSLPV